MNNPNNINLLSGGGGDAKDRDNRIENLQQHIDLIQKRHPHDPTTAEVVAALRQRIALIRGLA